MSDKPQGVIYVYEEELDELGVKGKALLRGRERKDGEFWPSKGDIAIVACNFINCSDGDEYYEYEYCKILYVVVENIQLIRKWWRNIEVIKFFT